MRVRDLMTTPAFCLHPADTFAHARAEALGRHVHQLPVVDGEGRLVGMLAPSEVPAPRERSQSPVSRLMETGRLALRPEMTASEGRSLLEAAHVQSAPVLSRRRVVGMITLRDLARAEASAP